MKIHFHLDSDRFGELTLGAQIAMQKCQQGKTAELTGLIEMMAPFMQGDDGEWLDFDAACDLLKSVKSKELMGVVEQFTRAMEDYAVPKGNGNSSKLPSSKEESARPGSPTS